jgi:ketosteroid isomerase-like protein
MSTIAGPHTPERGYTYLADEVRRTTRFERAEVEAALRDYEARGQAAVASGDWKTWAEQFSDDAIYVEHQYGVMRGQPAISAWITSTMQGHALELDFPIQWSVIDNDLVVAYIPNRYRSRDGGPDFQFSCVTILCYAGDGKWCYEEDVYNAIESGRVHTAYAAANGANKAG